MKSESMIAVLALVVLIGIPFWFAFRPMRKNKVQLSKDNLTDDRVSHNSQTMD
jgi:preprotein translocase subunit YajC